MPITPAQEKQLNEAAKLILDQLPASVWDIIDALQQDYMVPLWNIAAGIILEQHLNGTLAAFQLDPQWEEGVKADTLVCKECGVSFKPVNINQPYCTNECGDAAFKKREGLKDEPKPDTTNITMPSLDALGTSTDSDAGRWGDVAEELASRPDSTEKQPSA